MKYLGFLLLFISPLYGQISDDFSDGNFTENPTWFGKREHFEITPEKKLRLKAPRTSGSSYLYVKSPRLENTSWELSFQLDFNPSSSNYFDWYLAANDTSLKNSTNAYYVRVGGTKDKISLYRVSDSQVEVIIEGLEKRINRNPVKAQIKVSKSQTGEWSLWVNENDGNGWILEGGAEGHQVSESGYSGIHCVYTSTRSDKFYFDDIHIQGTPFVDKIPPGLMESSITNERGIQLVFADKDLALINANQFELVPGSNTINGIQQMGSVVDLIYENPLPLNENFYLKIKSIADTAGNTMSDTTLNFYLQQHQPFDIVIHEIMIEPEPRVELPNVEYVELYNRANYPITLENWKIKNGSSIYEIPYIKMEPNKFALLIDEKDSLAYGEDFVVTMSHWQSLNDSEGHLGVFDENDKLIHEVQYHKSWLNDSNKERGGWALEMIDPENFCGNSENWGACKNRIGGTPGYENSIHRINPDTLAPKITGIEVLDENNIQIHWSENIYDHSIQNFESYTFDPEITIKNISHVRNKTEIEFLDELRKGEMYSLQINEIKDCQNLSTQKNQHPFIKGVWAEKDSLFLNEILFNPKTGGYDYVELYNASHQYIDLSKLFIGNYDSLTSSINNSELVCQASTNIPPMSYLTLTEDTSWVKSNYPIEDGLFFIQMDRLPSFPYKKGSIVISNLAFEIMDQYMYHEDSHFPGLESNKGVALERLHHTSDKWFSASSSENYGTPSRKNSQFTYPSNSKAKLEVQPEVFSPNLKEGNDFTKITLQPDEPLKVSMNIFNRRGHLVKELCKSELITKQSSWIWNGLNQEELNLPIGIYMIVVELWPASGKPSRLKHPVVINY